jgi:hypothetical protein
MLVTFVVVALAVLLCGCTVGLRCIIVMFCRLGVGLLHYDFFLLTDECRSSSKGY